jgi:hypothetical protein
MTRRSRFSGLSRALAVAEKYEKQVQVKLDGTVVFADKDAVEETADTQTPPMPPDSDKWSDVEA